MIKGITASSFDLLHSGHVAMLEDCKRHCDYLVCAIQSDPTLDRPEKNLPVQSLLERFLQLRAIEFVDEIVPYTRERDLE